MNRAHSRAFIEVTYGTSKAREQERPLDLHISNMAEMNEAGLPQATCFVLGRTILLPWCAEFFTTREDGTGPIVGRLAASSVAQLEALKGLRRVGLR